MNLVSAYLGWAVWVKCSRPTITRRSNSDHRIYSRFCWSYSNIDWRSWSGMGEDSEDEQVLVDASMCPNSEYYPGD